MAASPDDLVVSRSLVLDAADLEWRFSGSGGPGGQHANTANTRVELRLDVRTARSLGPRQRARLLERLGPVVRVVASDERSQLRNRELARARLAERVRQTLQVQPARRPTAPTVASRERRLADKRRRAERKASRRLPDDA